MIRNFVTAAAVAVALTSAAASGPAMAAPLHTTKAPQSFTYTVRVTGTSQTAAAWVSIPDGAARLEMDDIRPKDLSADHPWEITTTATYVGAVKVYVRNDRDVRGTMRSITDKGRIGCTIIVGETTTARAVGGGVKNGTVTCTFVPVGL